MVGTHQCIHYYYSDKWFLRYLFYAFPISPAYSLLADGRQDIALFLPTMAGPPDASSGIVFMAFHVNCPNRYLSEDSINIVKQNLGSYPVYILGRIITIERHVGSEVHELTRLTARV